MGDRKCDTSYATGGVSLWSGELVNYALPWIYYSSQILLLGAEFNQVLRRAGRSRVCSRQIRCSVVALGPWGDAILMPYRACFSQVPLWSRPHGRITPWRKMRNRYGSKTS